MTQIIVDGSNQQIVVDNETQIVTLNPIGPQGPPGPAPTVNAYSGQGPFIVRALTQLLYDSITTDPNTLYLIIEE